MIRLDWPFSLAVCFVYIQNEAILILPWFIILYPNNVRRNMEHDKELHSQKLSDKIINSWTRNWNKSQCSETVWQLNVKMIWEALQSVAMLLYIKVLFAPILLCLIFPYPNVAMSCITTYLVTMQLSGNCHHSTECTCIVVTVS